MKQEYEYTTRKVDWDRYGVEVEEVTELLNAYAKRGWEYVETVVPHTGAPVTVFRRRLTR